MKKKSVKALVLRTAGTNCDMETVHALRICGAEPELLHLNEILREKQKLGRYSIMVIPGGFSYGDDIAAGKILANELKFKLGPELKEFIAKGKLLLGICNGFQVLVKTGFLPGTDPSEFMQDATLTYNDSGRFQCEWVGIKKVNSKAKWLDKLPAEFELPIAHGEGKFVTKDKKVLKDVEENGHVVFRYAPANPNGSENSIAGICNSTGNVVGMMPHPERFITKFQHPAWTRKKFGAHTPGFLFWQAAVNHAKEL